jgi:hypothetical protein
VFPAVGADSEAMVGWCNKTKQDVRQIGRVLGFMKVAEKSFTESKFSKRTKSARGCEQGVRHPSFEDLRCFGARVPRLSRVVTTWLRLRQLFRVETTFTQTKTKRKE